MTIDKSPRPVRITVFKTKTDTVGVDISSLFRRDPGLVVQRSPFTAEDPIVCTAEFSLIYYSTAPGTIGGQPALKFLSRDTSQYLRPGAPILFEYQNYAGTWREIPWGARQVIKFVNTYPPSERGFWIVEIQCHQTLAQQQVSEAAFDLDHGQQVLGVGSTAHQICQRACIKKNLDFDPQAGDPVPNFVNTVLRSFNPKEIDSELAHLQKTVYCNPRRSKHLFGLWQDNQNRVRLHEANLSTTRTTADKLITGRWATHESDLIDFKIIPKNLGQMPGKMRILGLARVAQLKPNPVSSTKTANGMTVTTSSWNNWNGGQHILIKKTTASGTRISSDPDAPASVLAETETTIKTYDLFNNHRLVSVETKRTGPAAIVDGGSSFGETEISKTITRYYYKADGTLDYESTDDTASPVISGGTGTSLEPFRSGVTMYGSGGGSDWQIHRASIGRPENFGQNMIYATPSDAGNAESRPGGTETQEYPWYTKEFRVWQDRELLFNGVPVSDRFLPVDVGAFVMAGFSMPDLADSLVIREMGQYSQRLIKFPLTDAIADKWVTPGLGFEIFDEEDNTTKLLGDFGGATIVFGGDKLECAVNAEMLGTTDGDTITVAATARTTSDGAIRVLSDGTTARVLQATF